ncbi:restriction endonuclease subunit S [Trichococcus shcherbakoviae]|uniref:restriction endonuclease subunit S n=1 Tax=Trichococcus shcherbakoviae TaxID=2094020 RepID=UPI0029F592A9|nr:restriction endonuclease subunit S [Trichococcus shcherbakoviae]
MNTNIELALNILYQRQLSTREQLLNEMLRVKLTLKNILDNSNVLNDKEKLFQFMKKTTEDDLGFFPADRDDFLDIFESLKDVDLIDFTLEIYKNDRMGTIISPKYINEYINEKIQKIKPRKILITEAEKHLSGLREIIKNNQNLEIFLTTQLKSMNILLKLAFGEMPNVSIRFESIYTDCLLNEKFDYIYSIPAFGYKAEELGKTFITRESDGVATQNMLEHLNEHGMLDIIVPAKITFASMGYKKLRTYITDNFNVKSIYILPEGTFRPATAIKTYFLTITTQPQQNIEIGTFALIRGIFDVTDRKILSTSDFLSHEDWRIELLLAEDDENMQRFKNSNLEKVKLKEVAEVFRGKSILKKDTVLGKISVLNISNIENGEIRYVDMDTIEEDERKIKRYELLSGDVVLSCRGTAIKSAVFENQNNTIIASANLIVIRPKERLIGEYIKIFFESPIGLAIIKSFQRGTTIMNINHSDIMEMEIPIIPISEQKDMINLYHKELDIYKKTISDAERRWTNIKDNLYNKLT